MLIITKIVNVEDGRATVRAAVEDIPKNGMIAAVHYETILRAMKDRNKRAFYSAMSQFVDAHELDDLQEFLNEEME